MASKREREAIRPKARIEALGCARDAAATLHFTVYDQCSTNTEWIADARNGLLASRGPLAGYPEVAKLLDDFNMKAAAVQVCLLPGSAAREPSRKRQEMKASYDALLAEIDRQLRRLGAG